MAGNPVPSVFSRCSVAALAGSAQRWLAGLLVEQHGAWHLIGTSHNVIPELSTYRPLIRPGNGLFALTKNCLHQSRGQIVSIVVTGKTLLAGRWAGGIFSGQIPELGPQLQFTQNVFCEQRAFNQNMVQGNGAHAVSRRQKQN